MSESTTSRSQLRAWELVWFPKRLAERLDALGDRTRRRLQSLLLDGNRSRLTVDLLEGRLACAADVGMLAEFPIDPETGNIIAFDSQPDPSTIEASIGPGTNELVSIENPPATGDAVNPADVPASIGPGTNELVSITPSTSEPDPGSIPVVVGPGDNELVANSPDVTDVALGVVLSGSDVGAPAAGVSLAFDNEIAEIAFTFIAPTDDTAPRPSERSRSTAGVGGFVSLSSVAVDDHMDMSPAGGITRDEGAPIVEALSTSSDNEQQLQELREAVDRWLETMDHPTLPGINDWHATPSDIPHPEDRPEGDYEHSSSDWNQLDLQIGPVGIGAGLWMAGRRSRSRRTSLNRSRRPERTTLPEDKQRVDVQDGDADLTLIARVRDISDHGMGLLHRGPLPTRTLIFTFESNGMVRSRSGVVRWTRRLSGNVFASGIQFE